MPEKMSPQTISSFLQEPHVGILATINKDSTPNPMPSDVAASEWSSSAGFFDLNNEGKLDLFVCRYLSIKEMEQVFGVSCPTIKSRLTRIAQGLEFVDTNPLPSRADILDRLKRGEINPQEAIQELESLK